MSYDLASLSRRWPAKNFPEQFVLCRARNQLPPSWPTVQLGDWLLGAHPTLPTIPIQGAEGAPIGWFLGYPIDESGRALWEEPIPISFPANDRSDVAIERWIYGHGGRYAVVLLRSASPRVYLDPMGSLSLVYSPSLEMVASTPLLFPGAGVTLPEHPLAARLGIPDSSRMYPMELTPLLGVLRLLPNHYLDLNRWEAIRHWPAPGFEHSMETDSALHAIATRAHRQVAALVSHRPAYLRLTGGGDSRTILALSRDLVDRLTIVTVEHEHPDEVAEIDCLLASQIARANGLRYTQVPFQTPTEADLEEWAARTGCSTGEPRGWRACTTYKQLRARSADLIGHGPELLRGRHRTREDDPRTLRDPRRLVDICRIEGEPLAETVMQTWLDTLPTRDPYLTLDLFHIEQRYGCWAGIFPYGFANGQRYAVLPFCHREILERILRIHPTLRFDRSLNLRLIATHWPELSRHPLSRATGLNRLRVKAYLLRHYLEPRLVRTLRDPRDAVRRIVRRFRNLGAST